MPYLKKKKKKKKKKAKKKHFFFLQKKKKKHDRKKTVSFTSLLQSVNIYILWVFISISLLLSHGSGY